MLAHMTAPYSALESFMYDHFIAPVVMGLLTDLKNEFVKNIGPGAKALDVGCGGGQLALDLAAARKDLNITGLDLSIQQIRRAKKRSKKSNTTAEFIQDSALSMPFEDKWFDVVYSIGSIKHWPDHKKGLKECLRVLKPGGTLLIIEIDKNCSKEDARSFIDKWPTLDLFRPLTTKIFLKLVAGHSISVYEAQTIIDSLHAGNFTVQKVPDTVVWVMIGVKQAFSA